MTDRPLHDALDAYQVHCAAAHDAFAIYKAYCNDHVPPRVPGMDTVIRLAYRISRGKTIEEAAAREYVYRWHLAILAPDQCGASGTLSRDPQQRYLDRPARNACVSVFGTPHLLGM